jgi:hypothetical protein
VSRIDPDAEAHLANRERTADTGALDPDADALEELDAGPGALDDLDVDLERVARAEVGHVVAADGSGESVDGVGHSGSLSSSVPQVTHALCGATSVG